MPDTSSLMLGIDVGTSGTKVLLIDAGGAVVAEALHEYPLRTPRPGWSEQDPNDWADAAIRGIRDVLTMVDGLESKSAAARVAAVGLTGQMHGATLLDARGEVLRPAILWNDQRTGAQCAELTRRVGAERVLQLTGNPILTGFTAPKLLWVREHEPANFARVTKLLLPKDYVRYRLTGDFAADVSDASGTSLFDVARRDWSDEMCAAAEVPRAWLAPAAESATVVSRVSAIAAALTGLKAGTPVVAGAGDQAAGAVGMGIVAQGMVSVTIGTSGVVFAATDALRVEPRGRLHAFCHAVPGKWHLMGVMLSAGGSLRWLRDTVGEPEASRARQLGRDPYDLLLETAAGAPIGCGGLTFLPYLTGERTPHADPHARGVWCGVSPEHGRPALIRSVVEGVTFGLRDSFNLLRAMGVRPADVFASGGGARSLFWRQMLADVFDCRVSTVNTAQGAAYGAALLAGAGVGVWESVADACAACIRTTDTRVPAAPADAYDVPVARYRALYSRLADFFREFAH